MKEASLFLCFDVYCKQSYVMSPIFRNNLTWFVQYLFKMNRMLSPQTHFQFLTYHLFTLIPSKLYPLFFWCDILYTFGECTPIIQFTFVGLLNHSIFGQL